MNFKNFLIKLNKYLIKKVYLKKLFKNIRNYGINAK